MENEPFVLKGTLFQWPASEWTPEKMCQMLGDKRLKFRIGKKKHSVGKIQFENDCQYCKATMEEFFDWLNDRKVTDSNNNPFQDFTPKTHFAYLDYQYMFDLFDNNEDYLKCVCWNTFGLDRDGFESTLWMGTAGSYTPCHYDTYGFNLVAQLHGRKRWTLISPEQSSFMKPIRLPYEESSVFSNVDLLKPSSSSSFFTQITPRVVVLEPGDLLYVPRRWWHFVQCLTDGCISVNTWVDTTNDDNAKLSEAITRCIVGLVKNKCVDELLDNEVDFEDSLVCLNKLLMSDNNRSIDELLTEEKTQNSSPSAKKMKPNPIEEIIGDEFLQKFIEDNKNKANIVPMLSFEEFASIMDVNNETKDDEEVKNDSKNIIDEKRLINAILNPDTIELIKSLMLR